MTVATGRVHDLGTHALQGWRKRLADAAAPRVSRRTNAAEGDIRAALGLLFLVLTVRHLVVTLRRFASSSGR
jgi:hypothetical protein